MAVDGISAVTVFGALVARCAERFDRMRARVDVSPLDEGSQTASSAGSAKARDAPFSSNRQKLVDQKFSTE